MQDQVHDMVLTLGQLIRRIRAAAPSEMHQLSWTQRSVLARLERVGPFTTADLARAESIKPQSMGAAIVELEEAGFVERKPHPTDRRQFLVALTAKGRSVRKRSAEAKEAWFLQAIAKLSRQEQAALFAAGDLLKRLADS